MKEETIFIWQDLDAPAPTQVDYFSQTKKKQKEQMRMVLKNPSRYVFREIADRQEERRGEDWSIDDFLESTGTSVPEGRVSVLGGMMSSEYRRERGKEARSLRRSKMLNGSGAKTTVKVYDSVDDLDIFRQVIQKHRLGIIDSNLNAKIKYKVLEYEEEKELYGSFVVKDGDLIFRTTPKGDEYVIPSYLKDKCWEFHQKSVYADCAIAEVEQVSGDRRNVASLRTVFEFRPKQS